MNFPSRPSSVREQNRPMGSENCSSSRPAALPVRPIRVPPGLWVLLKEILLLESWNLEWSQIWFRCLWTRRWTNGWDASTLISLAPRISAPIVRMWQKQLRISSPLFPRRRPLMFWKCIRNVSSALVSESSGPHEALCRRLRALS
jgi:hypothetical protein